MATYTDVANARASGDDSPPTFRDVYEARVAAGAAPPPNVANAPAPNMNFGSSPAITEEGAVENTPAFINASREAMKDRGTASGLRKGQESGFTVDRSGNTSKVSVSDNIGVPAGVEGHMKQTVTPDTVLALHTHPDSGSPRPSQDDINAAKKSGHQIYVSSTDGLFGIDSKGNVTQIHKGTGWLSGKK